MGLSFTVSLTNLVLVSLGLFACAILSGLFLFPPLRSEGFLSEGVNGLQLLGQGRVDQPVPGQERLVLKLVAHNHSLELSTAARL